MSGVSALVLFLCNARSHECQDDLSVYPPPFRSTVRVAASDTDVQTSVVLQLDTIAGASASFYSEIHKS